MTIIRDAYINILRQCNEKTMQLCTNLTQLMPQPGLVITARPFKPRATAFLQ